VSVVNAEALLAIMRERRSIRRYTSRAVPRAVLERLLEAARWAPSAHNRQPWRFAVVTSAERRAALARAMGERFRADLLAEGLAEDAIEAQLMRSYARLSEAPALIVFFLSTTDMDTHTNAQRQQGEHLMAVQSVALAVQNLLLAAHAEGLGACWVCAPLFVPQEVQRALDVPQEWVAQGLVTLGYPSERPTRARDPIEAKTRWYT